MRIWGVWQYVVGVLSWGRAPSSGIARTQSTPHSVVRTLVIMVKKGGGGMLINRQISKCMSAVFIYVY